MRLRRAFLSTSSTTARDRPSLYRLVYFNSRGAVELTRYLLAVAEVPYDDIRYPLHATAAGFGVGGGNNGHNNDTTSPPSSLYVRDQQAGAFRVNMDKLPVLQVLTPDGKAAVTTLGQSHAINRFLANQHGLMGPSSSSSSSHDDKDDNTNNDWIQRAQIDAVYESVRDIKSDFMRTKKRNHSAALSSQNQQRVDWMQNALPLHCQRLEASLPMIRRQHSSTTNNNHPWLFDTLSLADVAVFALLGTATSTVTGSLVTALDDLDPRPAWEHSCPRLSASIQALAALPSIQAWHTQRPDTFS